MGHRPQIRSTSVRCWVSCQTRANALYVATGWIQEEGWTITALIEQREVMRTDYAGHDEEHYYAQALTDGEVFVFEMDGSEEEGGN